MTETIALPAPYSLHAASESDPFLLRSDGRPVRSASRWNPEGWNALAAEDSPELRAFAAAMVEAAEADDYRPIDAATPRTGALLLGFGQHDIGNGSQWAVGDFWWATIRWDVWRTTPCWTMSNGLPTWSQPSHWAPLKPPRALLRRIEAERRPA